jgi:hypothetical protein
MYMLDRLKSAAIFVQTTYSFMHPLQVIGSDEFELVLI